ncbi:hypothetical protein I4U23_020727 [Adineta vaga]|nr:hypothetical protein I4U23_020727 [Adineta vaga]
MTEIVDQTFLTALPDESQELKSFVLSENIDQLDIQVESSNDFEYKSVNNDDLEETHIERKQTPEVEINNNISQENPSFPSAQQNSLQADFTRSVYDYAAVVYSKAEDPHQNRLDHDIQKILGSSDPPPGFGFLHPKVYYLTQNRPTPMEPLRNGCCSCNE